MKNLKILINYIIIYRGHIISHHHGFIKSPYLGFAPSFPVCFFQTSITVAPTSFASTLYPSQTPFLLPTPVPMVPSIIWGHAHSYPPVKIATPILSAPLEINRQWIPNSNALVPASSLIQARNWEISKNNLRVQGITFNKFHADIFNPQVKANKVVTNTEQTVKSLPLPSPSPLDHKKPKQSITIIGETFEETTKKVKSSLHDIHRIREISVKSEPVSYIPKLGTPSPYPSYSTQPSETPTRELAL